MKRGLVVACIVVGSMVLPSASTAGAEECTNVPDPASGPCGTALGVVNDANGTVECVLRWLALNPC